MSADVSNAPAKPTTTPQVSKIPVYNGSRPVLHPRGSRTVSADVKDLADKDDNPFRADKPVSANHRSGARTPFALKRSKPISELERIREHSFVSAHRRTSAALPRSVSSTDAPATRSRQPVAPRPATLGPSRPAILSSSGSRPRLPRLCKRRLLDRPQAAQLHQRQKQGATLLPLCAERSQHSLSHADLHGFTDVELLRCFEILLLSAPGLVSLRQ